MRKPIAVVAGAGPGIGAALARRFAPDYELALLARQPSTLEPLAKIKGAHLFPCDLGSSSSVTSTFAAIRRDLGEVDTLLYNAGQGLFQELESTTAAQFEQLWRVNALGAFLCAQEVMTAMKTAGAGNIIFTGATASIRGGAKTAAFAASKAAQRSLAESLAKALWPAGIHIALVVVDGIVDTPRTRAMVPGKSDDFFVGTAGVAETVFQLCHQDRSAWSFQVEARPFAERW
jgi:NAD(P)-dependent dehydrogenase (short-subunit alcohol dehydrogenase family)